MLKIEPIDNKCRESHKFGMETKRFNHLWTLLLSLDVVRAADKEKIRLCVAKIYENPTQSCEEIVPRKNCRAVIVPRRNCQTRTTIIPCENNFSCQNWTKFAATINGKIGFTPNPAPGIFARGDEVVLKSVDGTSYYDDDVTNRERVIYTGFGREGDQEMSGVNQKLLEATRIWLYRVIPLGKHKKEYLWYGEYKIAGAPYVRRHPDINGSDRNIYLFNLKRIGY
jgi:hypothetical protein